MITVKAIPIHSLKRCVDRHQLPIEFLEDLAQVIETCVGEIHIGFDPSVAALQPHGHWIRHSRFVRHPNPYMDDYWIRHVCCSHCGFKSYLPEKIHNWDLVETAACSSCGCLMDDGIHEEYDHTNERNEEE